MWLTFAVGLFTGLFVALVFYLQDQKQEQTPTLVKGPVMQAPVAEETRPSVSSDQTQQVEKADKKAQSKTKDEEETVSGIPKFDFYTILPKLEVLLPDEDVLDKRENEKSASLKSKNSYILQVGSFRQYSEADRLKARLALLGVVSSIQKVSIKNDETWHRVRVGPLSSYRKIDSLRRRLNSNNISSIILKVKAGNT